MQFQSIFFITCLCGITLSIPTKPLRPSFSQLQSKGLQNGLGIIGGSPASIKSFPYTVSIFAGDGYFAGSGAIVGNKFILTSAFLVSYLGDMYVRVGSANVTERGQYIAVQNCTTHEKFYYYNYDVAVLHLGDMYVRVGGANVTEGGQYIAVQNCTTHEKFKYYNYDVALLQLVEEIKYGKSAKPIKLASKQGKNATSAVVSGFGATSAPSLTVYEGILQKGIQNVISTDTCQKYYPYITLDESNSCAYSATVCPCYQDIGDPLVQNNKLLGYYLGGSFCCEDSNPKIYSSVPSVKKWVKDQMKKAGYNVKEDVGYYYEE